MSKMRIEAVNSRLSKVLASQPQRLWAGDARHQVRRAFNFMREFCCSLHAVATQLQRIDPQAALEIAA